MSTGIRRYRKRPIEVETLEWTGANFDAIRVLAIEMGLDACNLITSAGSAATQTVMHLHVHVVPRREDDGLALPWTGQKKAA